MQDFHMKSVTEVKAFAMPTERATRPAVWRAISVFNYLLITVTLSIHVLNIHVPLPAKKNSAVFLLSSEVTQTKSVVLI